MKKIIFALVAIIFSASVFSHGPTPQKVQESVTIAASPQKTWEALKNYSELKKIMKVRSFKDKLMKAKYELIEKGNPMNLNLKLIWLKMLEQMQKKKVT